MSLRRLALLVPALLGAFALSAFANPIQYAITLNTAGGQVVTGTVTYDANTQTVSQWYFDINVTDEFGFGHSTQPVVLTSADGNSIFQGTSGNPLDFSFDNQFNNVPTYSQLTFYFTSLPGNTLANFGQFFVQDNPGDAGVNFVSGTAVVATPEPATWALCGTGLLLFGGLLYTERRRAGNLA